MRSGVACCGGARRGQLTASFPCCPRLDEAGYEVGSRILEVLVARERANRRDTRLQGVLQFIHTNVWRSLFGRVRLLACLLACLLPCMQLLAC